MDRDRDAVASGFGRYENGDGDEDEDIFTAPNISIEPINCNHNRFNQNENNEST